MAADVLLEAILAEVRGKMEIVDRVGGAIREHPAAFPPFVGVYFGAAGREDQARFVCLVTGSTAEEYAKNHDALDDARRTYGALVAVRSNGSVLVPAD